MWATVEDHLLHFLHMLLCLTRKAIDCIVITSIGCDVSHKLYNLLPHLVETHDQMYIASTKFFAEFSTKNTPYITEQLTMKPTPTSLMSYCSLNESSICVGAESPRCPVTHEQAVDQTVSLGKTVDCIVISEGGSAPHNYSIYYLSLKDSSFHNKAAFATRVGRKTVTRLA